MPDSSHDLLTRYCTGKITAREFLERKQQQLEERRRKLAAKNRMRKPT